MRKLTLARRLSLIVMGVLVVMSDVYVAAVNNLNVIERDIDSADRLREHLERMVGLNQYMSSCRLVFEPGYGPAVE